MKLLLMMIISYMTFDMTHMTINNHKNQYLSFGSFPIITMKDFSHVLDQTEISDQKKDHFLQHIDQLAKNPVRYDLEYFKNKAIKYVSPFLMGIITIPFNTASILLQISDKPMTDALGKKLQLVGKSNEKISSLLKLGIFGDNKIYRPIEYKNYNDCLRHIGRQGFKGLYKGGLCGILMSLCNTNMRTFFYDEILKITQESQLWTKNLYTVLTCSLADFLTMPILFCQSRLVFQNSLSNFRTYNNPISILRSSSLSSIWAGTSLILLKNILFSYSWLSFFNFIFSTLLSHVTVYPFLTVIRQLQCNEPGVAMMHQRKEKVRECITRIWKNLGFRGFYRGFFGYSLVHLFLGFIMVESSMRSGFFQQIDK